LILLILIPRKVKEVFTNLGSNIEEIISILANIFTFLFPIIFIYSRIQISSILASLALRALVTNIALIY
jgi:hypothetical protein